MTAPGGEFDEILKTLGEKEEAEFRAGYFHGLEDKYIHGWQRRYHSRVFLKGYDLGWNELEEAIQSAIEARNSYGEFE